MSSLPNNILLGLNNSQETIEDDEDISEVLSQDFGSKLSLRLFNEESVNGNLVEESNEKALRRNRRCTVQFDGHIYQGDHEMNEDGLPYNQNHPPMTWTDDTIESIIPRRTGYRIGFEIISAKTVTDARSISNSKRYVCYTILIKRMPGLETHPGLIERRYSDFLRLFLQLRKQFPNLFYNFVFPKKTLVGNFNAEIITQRSIAFTHLLTYCLSIPELKSSRPFSEFLYGREFEEVRNLLKSSHFEEASIILENSLFILEKMCLHHDEKSGPLLYRTLSSLIACLNASEEVEEAQRYAIKAVQMISTNEFDNNELTLPLLNLAIRLYWSTGQDKRPLEAKLAQLLSLNNNQKNNLTLLESILEKDYFRFPF